MHIYLSYLRLTVTETYKYQTPCMNTCLCITVFKSEIDVHVNEKYQCMSHVSNVTGTYTCW